MNIERIEAHDFGSYDELDLRIEPGVSLISGANGSGKSTILRAVEWALFGATTDAGRLIRRGTDKATVEVRVRVEQGLLFVERTVRRAGSTTKIGLDVLIQLDGEDQTTSISGATVSETQATLDGLLGVSREVLEASAFAMQGRGSDFCEANPRERKRVFSEILALGFWDSLADQALAEKKAALAAAAVARSQVEQLDGAADRLAVANQRQTDALVALASAQSLEHDSEQVAAKLATEAEQARDARREHALAVATEREAAEAYAVAGREQVAAVEALERASAAAANTPDIHDARTAVRAASDSLEAIEAAYRESCNAIMRYRNEVDAAQRSVANDADAQRANETALDGYIAALAEEERKGECSRCGQSLATASTRFFAEAQIESARVDEQVASACLALAREKLAELTVSPAADPDDTPLLVARTRAEVARTKLAEAETIQSLAGSIDAAQARVEEAKARATAAYARRTAARDAIASYEPSPTDVEADYQTALAAVSQARQAHSGAAVELARAEAAAQQAERDAEREATAREQLAAAERDAVVAGVLASGFGPTGVPAMVVDSVLGDLADEANRVLAELGSPIRCDLRSQRLTRDDRLVDTLDILALMDRQEAPYETLSGGERTRLALALRAALTRLLASKRGARVRLLVVDEPAGLDASGCEQLAAVLEEFVRASIFDTVILVTHQSELAEQIGRVIRVEKTPGGVSRLVESVSSPQDVSSGVATGRAQHGGTPLTPERSPA